MIVAVRADLVTLLKGLIDGLQPFAKAQGISLSFSSEFSRLVLWYQPEEVVSNLTKLICRIITFTPQNQKVDMTIWKKDQHPNFLTTSISNSGINLAIIGEMNSGISYPLISEGDDDGSTFRFRIPLSETEPKSQSIDLRVTDHSLIKPWYSEIRKRLTSHFSNPQHIENLVRQRSDQAGMFLKKVNAVVHDHLDQEGFSAEDLAKKVALSRTQLFRKVKGLTQMAPGQYIRFVRLQKAKELLERNDLNVSEVAYKVGFVSNSHFSRAFHRQFGINPSALK